MVPESQKQSESERPGEEAVMSHACSDRHSPQFQRLWIFIPKLLNLTIA